MDELHVVLAKEKDTNVVLEVLNEATQYKNKHSDDSWGSETWEPNEIKDTIQACNRYLVLIVRDVVGCFVLDWSDTLWPDDSTDAAYIHQLAVKNRYHGLDIGSKILDIAANIAKKNNKHLLRLDCHYDNKKLYEYYKKMNFKLQGTVKSKTANHTIALLQKNLS